LQNKIKKRKKISLGINSGDYMDTETEKRIGYIVVCVASLIIGAMLGITLFGDSITAGKEYQAVFGKNLSDATIYYSAGQYFRNNILSPYAAKLNATQENPLIMDCSYNPDMPFGICIIKKEYSEFYGNYTIFLNYTNPIPVHTNMTKGI